jgi:acylphosphatase
MSPNSQLVGARIVVRGRVQMVGFRAFVVTTAGPVGGTVRNLSDGTVECIAEGRRDQIEELIVGLRQGPPAARVDSVAVSWQRPGGLYTGMRAI